MPLAGAPLSEDHCCIRVEKSLWFATAWKGSTDRKKRVPSASLYGLEEKQWTTKAKEEKERTMDPFHGKAVAHLEDVTRLSPAYADGTCMPRAECKWAMPVTLVLHLSPCIDDSILTFESLGQISSESHQVCRLEIPSSRTGSKRFLGQISKPICAFESRVFAFNLGNTKFPYHEVGSCLQLTRKGARPSIHFNVNLKMMPSDRQQ